MHIIRLRGPWKLEPVCRYVRRPDGGFDHSKDSLPGLVRMRMPADWSSAFGGDFLGRVCYKRTFHAPPGLVPEERVWLVVEPQRSEACIVLAKDRQELVGFVSSDEAPGRFDITEALDSVNHLEIYVDHPAISEERSTISDDAIAQPGGLVGEVRLEIEE